MNEQTTSSPSPAAGQDSTTRPAQRTMPSTARVGAEQQRIEASRDNPDTWRRWGPYLSERAWGTVREDYSSDGSAWDFFPHDVARSRAYRWNEDGLAGISDDKIGRAS